MCLFFFFKQKTAYEMRISDWSSDVCSSDLACTHRRAGHATGRVAGKQKAQCQTIEDSRHLRRQRVMRTRDDVQTSTWQRVCESHAFLTRVVIVFGANDQYRQP